MVLTGSESSQVRKAKTLGCPAENTSFNSGFGLFKKTNAGIALILLQDVGDEAS